MNRQHDPDHDEIVAVARELWRTRGMTGGSPEEDWYRAEQIVRERHTGSGPRALQHGNIPASNESYKTGTGTTRTAEQQYRAEGNREDQNRKENSVMDTNTLTGTTEHTGSQSSNINTSGSIGGQSSSGGIGASVSGAMNRVSEYMQNDPVSMPHPEHREGRLARSIEQQTAKIPSDAWLWAAVGSIGLSLALELSGKEKTANFVGHWAPTFLILGLYNKIVKLQGSDGL